MTSTCHAAAIAFGAAIAMAPLSAKADDCVAIAPPVWFCYPSGSWETVDDGSPETVASYVSPMQVFAQFFVTEGGENAGDTIDAVLASVRENMAQSMSGTEVTVVETSPAEVDGIAGQTIVLSPTDGERTAMITATIIVTPDHTLRLVTVAASDIYSENIRAMHGIFLDEIRLSDPNE